MDEELKRKMNAAVDAMKFDTKPLREDRSVWAFGVWHTEVEFAAIVNDPERLRALAASSAIRVEQEPQQ